MKKADISAALAAAGIEHDPAATVAVLTALAAEKGVSLSAVPNEPEAAEEAVPSAIDEAAKAEVAAMRPAAAPEGITEEAIRAKIEESLNGLSRAQAIEVLKAQAEHDATQAKEAKAKG